ncbi:hypothetical protein MGG_10973 [Pyricularia oryzae 70-15]|uniref:Oxo-4-hydroxy-4-carboxy-5-ureidoimidazoline decarboxylase domain-containing protein n=2 Tax=Pyricularia oryzae TaxID=318829 RepID=G4NBX3_PYRO7|nr:uncharacterized protein MGG_10973 [Pyricularia oryzae 70-15]EHA48175.1 hypothetical protein MGG_10973 [Pyricularia oryzae 70-15]KAI7914179.1 hypothetical protein M9X92_009100 [Pyricularia oryzae]KAI7916118.1 hypothetical protein M0657_008752 [Pyricularia oryzae]QBZ62006.1 hypothetical protein PoMZ_10880 [Pyricularia oryzae]
MTTQGGDDTVPLPALPPQQLSTSSKVPSKLPAIAALPGLDDASLIGTLDLLFEASPDLHALAVPVARSMTFTSYRDLIESIRSTLLSVQATVHADPVARKPLLGILAAHPRLGERKQPVSDQSKAEQASLQGEAEKLATLNAEYEAKFPGMRYVVFVNGRSRDIIMENMRARIDRGDMNAEEQDAINAMCDIAHDRAIKLNKI